MARRQFSIDPDRLARFRSEAEGARGASLAAARRVRQARQAFDEVEADLDRIRRSPAGQPRAILRPGRGGRRIGRAESQHSEYIEAADRRVQVARAALDRAVRDQAAGASERDHAAQLFARLEKHVQRREP